MRTSKASVAALTLLVLASCTNAPSVTVTATAPPVNPSALGHLTYDCSILPSEPPLDRSGPLFYLEPFDDGGAGKSRMCAVDWQGKLRREISRGLALRQSADGSRLLVVDYPMVNSGPATYSVIDEEDHVLAQTSAVWQDDAIWADDSRHLCYITDSNGGRGGVASLEMLLPGSPARAVTTIGFTTYLPRQSSGGPAPTPFVAGPRLLACSIRMNRAVVLDPRAGSASIIRLSDGASLMRHAFGHQFFPYGNPPRNETTVVSADGQYLAETVDRASTVPIIDLLTDQVVRVLHVRLVAGFSWDDTLAVVRLDDRVGAVLNWRTGQVTRRLAGAYVWSMPRPDSSDVLVGVPSTRHEFGYDLYVVRASGTAFEVARSVEVVS